MRTSIPEAIARRIADQLNTTISAFSFSGGGCINHGGRLTTSAGDFFLKWNHRAGLPQMFECEARGLRLLRNAGAINVPQVHFTGEAGAFQFILMEFIDTAPKSSSFWRDLAGQLATLHKTTAEKFGLDHDNYIGSLAQLNAVKANWIEFFIEKRLRIQLRLAMDGRKLEKATGTKFEKLFQKLPSFLTTELPSLLHGDLWSGNLIAAKNGDPCLIDPAVYFGHREAEIAFTMLFGGFPAEFYEAYDENFPIMPGFQERSGVYNLYPLLVHTNLFGGGYGSQVVSILDRFV